jgi:sodium-dependent dicarboxylate transporter 2/3/5
LEWKADFAKIPFAIIFLFGARFSIAMAFQKTGLATEVANILVSFNYFPPILLMLIIGSGVVFAAELTSNTALTSILIRCYSYCLSLFRLVMSLCYRLPPHRMR